MARLTRPRGNELTTIVGSFANIQPGQTLQLTGFWRDHPQFGPQFQVVNYKKTKPATLTGIEKYLGSGLIKGVGPVTARRIVAHFGFETLDIIENQIERLIEIQGIAKKRIKLIKNAWETQKAIKEVMVFLQGHGVSTTYAVKIYKQYGDKAIATIDSQSVKSAAMVSQSVGFDAGKKIKGRKRFLTVDTLGLVLRVLVTAANVGEREGGKQVLKRVKQSQKQVSRLTTLWVDGGFDGEPFMQWVMDFCRWIVQVVLRPEQTKGFVLLKKRQSRRFSKIISIDSVS